MGQKLSGEDKDKYAEHLRLIQSEEAQEDDAKNDDVGDEFAR